MTTTRAPRSESETRAVGEALRATYFAGYTEDKLSTPPYKADFENHLFGRFNTFRNHFVPWIGRRLPLGDATVLEIGSGTGSSTAAIAEVSKKVIAFDIDDRSVKAAQARLAAMGLNNVDFHLVPPADVLSSAKAQCTQGVDVVLLYALLEHQTFRERIDTLKTAWDLLNPGGIIAVGELPNRLTYMDKHTSMAPFYNMIADDVALEYARFVPRAGLHSDLERARQRSEAHALDLLTRWGRSCSFHDFQLVFGDLAPLVVGDGFDPEIRAVRRASLDERLLYTLWRSENINVPVGFCRSFIDVLLRKPGGPAFAWTSQVDQVLQVLDANPPAPAAPIAPPVAPAPVVTPDPPGIRYHVAEAWRLLKIKLRNKLK